MENAAPLKKKPLQDYHLCSARWIQSVEKLLTHPAGGIDNTDPSNLATSFHCPVEPSE